MVVKVGVVIVSVLSMHVYIKEVGCLLYCPLVSAPQWNQVGCWLIFAD